MTPLMPFPELSSIVVAPAGSFICQVATGWSMAARAGDTIATAAASATTTMSNVRRMVVLLGLVQNPSPTSMGGGHIRDAVRPQDQGEERFQALKRYGARPARPIKRRHPPDAVGQPRSMPVTRSGVR